MPLFSPHNGGSGGPGEANMLPGTRDASQHVGWVVAASAVAVTVVVLVLVVVVVYPRGGINDVTVRHPSKQRWQPLPNPNPNPRHALADNNGWWGGDECSLLRVAARVGVAIAAAAAVLLRFVQRGVWLTKLANIYQQLQRGNSPRRRKRKVKNFSCREEN